MASAEFTDVNLEALIKSLSHEEWFRFLGDNGFLPYVDLEGDYAAAIKNGSAKPGFVAFYQWFGIDYDEKAEVIFDESGEADETAHRRLVKSNRLSDGEAFQRVIGYSSDNRQLTVVPEQFREFGLVLTSAAGLTPVAIFSFRDSLTARSARMYFSYGLAPEQVLRDVHDAVVARQ
jgi:hypothetical protein